MEISAKDDPLSAMITQELQFNGINYPDTFQTTNSGNKKTKKNPSNRRKVRPHNRKCEICGKAFIGEWHLRIHLRTHTGEKPFICDHCGLKFTTKHQLTLHFRRIHEKRRPYECNICNQRFCSTSDLNRHGQVHTNEKPFICEHCGFRYARRYELNLHVRRHHRTEHSNFSELNVSGQKDDKIIARIADTDHDSDSVYCAVLVEGTEDANAGDAEDIKAQKPLETSSETPIIHRPDYRHQVNQRLHKKLHRYRRHISGVKFCSRRDQIERQRVIRNRNTSFLCKQCGLKWPSKVLLNDHVQRHHDVEELNVAEQFDCSQYDRQIKGEPLNTACQSDKHFEFDVDTAINDDKHRSMSSSSPSSLVCDQCFVKFSRPSDRLKHIRRVHEKQRPHKCDDCGVQFGGKSELNKHRLLHTGEKPFSCDQCDYKTRTRHELKRHVTRSHGGGPNSVSCKQCNYKFSGVVYLNEHIKRVHIKLEVYKCDVCNVSFEKKFALTQHLQRYHGGQSAKELKETKTKSQPSDGNADCAENDDQINTQIYETVSVDSDLFHCVVKIERTEDAEVEFADDLKTEKFNLDIQGQSDAEKSIVAELFDCDQYDHAIQEYQFEIHRRSQLDETVTHIKGSNVGLKTVVDDEIHRRPSNAPQYVCDQCGVRFTRASDRRRHVRRVHEKQRPHECDICGLKLCDTNSLRLHRLIHTGEMSFDCDWCDFKTRQKQNLEKHVVEAHSGRSEPLTCEQCNCKFSGLQFLKSHKRRVHPDSSSNESATTSAEVPEENRFASLIGKESKSELEPRSISNEPHIQSYQPEVTCTKSIKFACDQCDHEFTRPSDRTKHIRRVHEKQRPHKCDYCGVQFGGKSELKKHRLLHTGEKPFPCNQCDYKTRTRHELKRHVLRNHGGSESFSCKHCNCKFSGVPQLNTHIKRAHIKPQFYKCDACHAVFEKKFVLTQHVRRCHGKRLAISKTPIEETNIHFGSSDCSNPLNLPVEGIQQPGIEIPNLTECAGELHDSINEIVDGIDVNVEIKTEIDPFY